jgi:hypothetical protein
MRAARFLFPLVLALSIARAEAFSESAAALDAFFAALSEGRAKDATALLHPSQVQSLGGEASAARFLAAMYPPAAGGSAAFKITIDPSVAFVGATVAIHFFEAVLAVPGFEGKGPLRTDEIAALSEDSGRSWRVALTSCVSSEDLRRKYPEYVEVRPGRSAELAGN